MLKGGSKKISCPKCKLCKDSKPCKRYRKCSRNRCSKLSHRLNKSKSSKKSCKIGTRAQVYHKTCERTNGGLIKKDLMYNSIGKLVSKRASRAAKKAKNLGNFQAPVNSYAFRKSPKKGSKAYEKLKSL